jgi:acyl carrier protein
MHPSFYIVGPLPRETSGKINKKALIVPAPAVIPSSVPVPSPVPVPAATAPSHTSAESDLLHLFSDVLHLDPARVSVDDSFFELGGNSLLAARLLTRLHAKYGVILPLTTLFSHSTVRLLASSLGLQPPPTPQLPTPSPPATTTEPETTPKQLTPAPISFSSIVPQNKFPLSKIQDGEKGKRPLFCVHPAGGNAMCFYPMALELRGYPIYVLEDNNQSDDETYSYKSLNHMAEGLFARFV